MGPAAGNTSLQSSQTAARLGRVPTQIQTTTPHDNIRASPGRSNRSNSVDRNLRRAVATRPDEKSLIDGWPDTVFRELGPTGGTGQEFNEASRRLGYVVPMPERVRRGQHKLLRE